MESRHKILLSRQRALLNRRASREKTQVPTQSGFFGRTHPERAKDAVHFGLPIHFQEQAFASNSTSHKPISMPTSQKDFSKPSHPKNTSNHQGTDEPWDAFLPVDKNSQAMYDALTRPPAHRREPLNRPMSNRAVATPALSQTHHPSRVHVSDPPEPIAPADKTRQPSMYSKLKSTLGLSSDYKSMSKSEAVIARITAVRAARMKRFHERNVDVSYRQKDIDNETMKQASKPNSTDDAFTSSFAGYRFYTHQDDFFQDPFGNNDDQSLSTNSNAVDYAATLAVD